jgi:hypothetical protein
VGEAWKWLTSLCFCLIITYGDFCASVLGYDTKVLITLCFYFATIVLCF